MYVQVKGLVKQTSRPQNGMIDRCRLWKIVRPWTRAVSDIIDDWIQVKMADSDKPASLIKINDLLLGNCVVSSHLKINESERLWFYVL